MPVTTPPRFSDVPQRQIGGVEGFNGTLAFLALITGNVALSFGPLFVRMADTGPVAAGFWRITLAAPVLVLLALVAGRRRKITGLANSDVDADADADAAPENVLHMDAKRWFVLALAGVAFAGDLGSWHLGIMRTTLANATLLGNCATFIFPIYGFVIARTWPSRTQGVALALAGSGAMLLLGRSYDLDPAKLAGDMFCLTAGLLYAVYFIVMSRIRERMPPMPALALSTIASIVPLLLFALAVGDDILPERWEPLLGLALISQVMGQGCMIFALGRASPLMIGLTLLIQPVVAATIGWLIYGELLDVIDWTGVALVAAALVLVRRRAEVAPVPPSDHVVAARSRP